MRSYVAAARYAGPPRNMAHRFTGSGPHPRRRQAAGPHAGNAAQVIEKALKELDDAYVFPDVAAKMRKHVEERVAAKEYDGVKTGQELAKR